jgi:hypothetical protein
MARGAILSMDQVWRLACAWFAADRGAPQWSRPTPDEVETLFDSLDLTGSFWHLR